MDVDVVPLTHFVHGTVHARAGHAIAMPEATARDLEHAGLVRIKMAPDHPNKMAQDHLGKAADAGPVPPSSASPADPASAPTITPTSPRSNSGAARIPKAAS